MKRFWVWILVQGRTVLSKASTHDKCAATIAKPEHGHILGKINRWMNSSTQILVQMLLIDTRTQDEIIASISRPPLENVNWSWKKLAKVYFCFCRLSLILARGCEPQAGDYGWVAGYLHQSLTYLRNSWVVSLEILGSLQPIAFWRFALLRVIPTVTHYSDIVSDIPDLEIYFISRNPKAPKAPKTSKLFYFEWSPRWHTILTLFLAYHLSRI